MSKVYAVRLQIKDFPPGYHSAWAKKEDAEKIAKQHDGVIGKYWVEEFDASDCDIKDDIFDRNLSVKLPGSVGRIVLQTPLPDKDAKWFWEEEENR